MLSELRDRIISFIIRWIVVGAHCGLCGAWMEHELVPSYWRVSVCSKCREICE